MTVYKVEEIEGIGTVMGEKFRSVDIYTTADLLEACKTPKGRATLADKTGISEKLILKFANMADLFRITGIAKEYSELLEAAGVDTVPELSHRIAEHLTIKMEEVNNIKQLTRRTPASHEVEKWIAQAKILPRVLEY